MTRLQNYFIISEQRLFTDLLKLQLSQLSDTGNVSQANNSGAALELAQRMKSGIVIIDCNIPTDGPFELISKIQSAKCRSKILLLLDSPSPIMIHQAQKLGIENIFLKTSGIQNFLLALKDITDGKPYLSNQIRKISFYDKKKNRFSIRIDSGLQTLSVREIEVLRYLSRGYAVKEVSRKMYLSPKSVDSHKYRIMQKLKIHDRVRLSRFCIREGLIQP